MKSKYSPVRIQQILTEKRHRFIEQAFKVINFLAYLSVFRNANTP
jgi:hypothetical protein